MLLQKQARPEPTEREKAHVSSLLKEIKAVLDDQEVRARFSKFEKWRKAYKGIRNGGEDGGRYRTNLIYANIAAMLPQVYAKDPDISFSPTENVPPGRYELTKRFAKTGEIVVREQLKRADLKRRAKSAIRSTMTVSMSWWKVGWQEDKRSDPVITNRINDIQDDLERLRRLAEQSQDAQGGDEKRLAREAELQAELAKLQQQNVEVETVKGVVIDPVKAEDVLILDDSVQSFDEYIRARKMAHRLWMRAEAYEETFGYKPEKGRLYARQGSEGGDATSGASKGYYCVFEVWDRTLNTVFTVCEGDDRYCRPPLIPKSLGERWYPFFGLIFNPVADEYWPLSDVELIEQLCEEYNDTRNDLAKHRSENLPVRLARAGGSLTEGDIQRIQNRKSADIIVINGTPGRPLQDDLGTLENPPLDPNNYETSPIRADMEMVLGASDASRGSVMKAKTATEAEIVAQGLRSRTEERQDTVEDMIEDVAKYVFEMCLLKLSKEEVQRIAGDQAEWPEHEVSVEQAYSWLNVRVQAGTSGKPNRLQEQDRWIDLMPTIKEAMTAIVEMRSAGNTEMASAVTELVRETMRRFDERIDVDKFLPPDTDGVQLEEMEPEQMRAALVKAQAVIGQLQDQLEQVSGERAAEEQRAQAEHERKLELERVKKEPALDQMGQPVMPAVDPVQALAPAIESMFAQLAQIQQAVQMIGMQPQAQQPQPVVIDNGGAVIEAVQNGHQALLQAVAEVGAATQQAVAQVAQAVNQPRRRVVEIQAPNGQVFRGESTEQ